MPSLDFTITPSCKELIKNDPEIDLELTGKFLHETDRIFINDREEVVYQIDKSEQVFLPDGTLKEERGQALSSCFR